MCLGYDRELRRSSRFKRRFGEGIRIVNRMGSVMASNRALVLVSQMWRDPRVADKEFDPELAEVIAEFFDERMVFITSDDVEKFNKELEKAKSGIEPRSRFEEKKDD